MKLAVGQEYTDIELDFMTKLPWKETKITYMGVSPYDNKHLFACEYGGCLIVPKGSKMLERLK